MTFQPEVLSPTPDPAFVNELQKIDRNLRVVWGYNDYLKKNWVIQRKLTPERYFANYASLFEQDLERFVDQPIYDVGQPIYDETGEEIGYRQVGVRRYDLAPEWEYLMSIEEPDGSFRCLDSRALTDLRRTYAWHEKHPLSRQRFEVEREREEAEAARKKKRCDLAFDTLMDHKREIWDLPFVGQPTKVMPGTEI